MQRAVTAMKAKGAVVISFDPPEIQMDQFRRLLDVDMRADLPQYLDAFAHPELGLDSVKDVVAFNLKDTLLHAPYGQGIFMRITKRKRSQVEFKAQKQQLMQTAKDYFEQTMDEYDLDAFLSIDKLFSTKCCCCTLSCLGCSHGLRQYGATKKLDLYRSLKKRAITT